MDIRNAMFRVLSSGSGTVGTTPAHLPGTADPYRLAVHINNCMPTGSLAELYVGFDSSVSASNHIMRVMAGGPPAEISARSTVLLWIVASAPGTTYAYAEVA